MKTEEKEIVEEIEENVKVGIPDIFRIINETVGLSMKIFKKPIRGTGSASCVKDIGEDMLDSSHIESINNNVADADYSIIPILNKINGCKIILIKVDRPYFEYNGTNICAMVNSKLKGDSKVKSLVSVIFIASNDNLSERQTAKLIKHELVHVAIKYATALLGLHINNNHMEEFLCDYIPYIEGDDDMVKAAEVMKTELHDYTKNTQDEYNEILEAIA